MLFRYKAFTKEGAPKEGKIEAVNAQAGISSLQRQGLFIASIQPDDWLNNITRVNLFGSVSGRDVVFLTRQLAALFKANVSALDIFRMLAEDSDNPVLRQTLNQTADDIQSGTTISDAMAKHPKVFSEFYVNMVRAGEESGTLDNVMLYLADYLERNHTLLSQARQSLIYPALVMVVAVAVMILVFTVINNQIVDVIIESGQEVPIYTQIVINFSDFILRYGIVAVIVIVAAAAVFFRWRQSPAGRRSSDRLIIESPVFGPLLQKLYLSRIADTFNTMITSGVPMIRTLEVASGVVNNRVYKDVLADAIEAVKAGQSLSQSFQQHPEISGAMVQITAVGEESGHLAQIMKTLADFYRREFTTTLRSTLSLIQPVMIIVLGVLVAIILLAILVPIYNVATSVGV